MHLHACIYPTNSHIEDETTFTKPGSCVIYKFNSFSKYKNVVAIYNKRNYKNKI